MLGLTRVLVHATTVHAQVMRIASWILSSCRADSLPGPHLFSWQIPSTFRHPCYRQGKRRSKQTLASCIPGQPLDLNASIPNTKCGSEHEMWIKEHRRQRARIGNSDTALKSATFDSLVRPPPPAFVQWHPLSIRRLYSRRRTSPFQ
jgi:hypothetical protein